MKNLVLLIVGLFCFSTSHADSDAKLDLSRGTIRTCDANSGEIGEVAFRAQVKRSSDQKGGMVLKIKSQISQCAISRDGKKAWIPLTGSTSQVEKIVYKFDNFYLLVSGDRGQFLSKTDLKAQDEQIIRISAEQLAYLGHETLIDIGAVSFRHAFYNDLEIDKNMTFFGSYLVQRLF